MSGATFTPPWLHSMYKDNFTKLNNYNYIHLYPCQVGLLIQTALSIHLLYVHNNLRTT
jgi:hypothetical protein